MGASTEHGREQSGAHGAVGLGKRVLRRVDRYQRDHAWAGFAFGVVKKFGDDQASKLAVLIAYYSFFSIFPLLLALVAILGFVLSGNPQLQERILDTALANFPVIGDQLRENLGSLDGSGVALVIGVAGLVWAGLGAVEAAENAFNSVWDVPIKQRPGFVSSKLRGVAMLAIVGIGIVATTLLAGVGTGLAGIGPFVRLAGVGVSLALNVALFLLAFKVLTDVDADWKTFLPGAAIAGTAWLLLQALGGWLVSNQLQDASQTYGAFAVVIALLSWLYIQAQVTLLAAEVNVVRAHTLWPRSLSGSDLTDADRRTLRRIAREAEQIPPEQVRVEFGGRDGGEGGERRAGDARRGDPDAIPDIPSRGRRDR